jgi:hypothetical protein
VTDVTRLSGIYQTGTVDDLAEHIAKLELTDCDEISYGEVRILRPTALAVARQALAQRLRRGATIAENLRLAAEREPPLNAQGGRNIGSWVGVHTPEWHAVFACSGPLCTPWFSHLDIEAQRVVLWLVAESLESNNGDAPHNV